MNTAAKIRSSFIVVFSSQVALFRQRYAALVAHHDVVQGSYPDQVQGLPQLVGQGEI
ncbi:hypothetical protein D3C81_2170430 [compost metagenome]